MRTKKAQPLFSFAVLMLLTSLMGCTSITSVPSKESLLTSQVFTLKLNHGRYGHAIVNNGEHIFVLGGSGKHGLLSSLEIIDPQTGTIEQVNNLLIPRRYHTAVWDGNDSIYIMGGMSAVTYGKKRRLLREPRMEVFDIPSRQSKIIGKIPEASRFGSAQYYDDKIFFMGGSRQYSATSTVGIYDVTKDKWKLTEKMPTPKDTKTIQYGQYLFAIGGYNGKSPLNVFERYNITTGKWQSLASIPQKLSAHSVVVFDNKIVSFGDYTRLDNTLIYDFKTEAWHQTTIGYLPSRHNAATVLNNRIYVIGGNTDGSGSHLDTIQVFGL
jgi:N-acetylneuraminic acid mutarotase